MIRAKEIFNSGHEQVIECDEVVHAFNGLEVFNHVNTASGEKMSVAIPVKEIGLIEYTEFEYAEPNVNSENQEAKDENTDEKTE